MGDLQKANDQVLLLRLCSLAAIQLKAKLLENEKREVEERKKFTKMQQKLISTEKDLAEVERKVVWPSNRYFVASYRPTNLLEGVEN